MTIKTAFARFTRPNAIHMYANGTTGSDKNNGLSETSPKKSLKGIFNSLPPRFAVYDSLAVKYNPRVYVHCRGAFETSEDNWIDSDLGDIYIYLDGGGEVETVAGPFEVTVAVNGLSVVKTGAGWTTDEFMGYMIKCTAGGSDLGTFRICTQNTEDTLYLPYIWSDATEVTIVKPATTLGSNTNTTPIGFNLFSPTAVFILSRMTINEPQFQCVFNGPVIYAAGLVIEKCAAIPFKLKGHGYLYAKIYYDIDDPEIPLIQEPFMAHGIGITSSAGNTEIEHKGSSCYMYSSVIGDLTIMARVTGSCLYAGCRCRKIFSRGSYESLFGGNAANWAGTKILNSDENGITIEYGCGTSSTYATQDPVQISNAAAHAIEVRRHGYYAIGNMQGSGNGGAGLYIHNESIARIVRNLGTALTGALGEVTIDGEFQQYTWDYFEPHVFYPYGEQQDLNGFDVW